MAKLKKQKEEVLMHAIIFTNGTYEDLNFYQNYLKSHPTATIIGVDGGSDYIHLLNKTPDYIVGDLDSIDQAILNQYKIEGVPIEQYSCQKDETDTELAIQYCIQQKYTQVTILGGLGTRFDHSFGNLYLLNRLLKVGIEAKMINEYNQIQLTNQTLKLQEKPGTTLSIMAFTDEAKGVTLKGFKYSVEEGIMNHYQPGYGISNVVVLPQQDILVKEGILLIDIIHEK